MNGDPYDLQEIFDRLNAQFHNNKIQARIKWGRMRGTHLWGVYKSSKKLIVINPALNDRRIPIQALEKVVHHEMCHQACPRRVGPKGKWEIHHPEFKMCENRYPNRREWRKWLVKNLQPMAEERAGKGQETLEENFKKYAHLYGLSPNDLGRSYRIRRSTFTIVGLDRARPKYPIRVRTQRGKIYIAKAEDVLKHLGKRSSFEQPQKRETQVPQFQSASKDILWARRIISAKRGRGRPSLAMSKKLKLARRILGMRKNPAKFSGHKALSGFEDDVVD